ncbi:MAG: OmpA family protein [Rubrimonas sp.]|uniref:OmpA family protein n=1 Tax=Rubrimonas sp. TaxID=2036015 RepID=UPI002FDEB492
MRKLSRMGVAAALVAAGALTAACQPAGQVGRTSTFDVAQATPEDIGRALDRDGRVVLRGVLFETDSARLSDAGRAAAGTLGSALQANPALRVAVVGHTDDTGDFRYNLDLSERRAEALAAALTRDHGVGENRLAAVGVGPLAPAVPNDTAEGRAQNRRVEVVVVR